MKTGDLVIPKLRRARGVGFYGMIIRIENFPPIMYGVDNSFTATPAANIVVLWRDGSETVELEADLNPIS